MNKKAFFDYFGVVATALIIFFALAYLYCSPVLQGKVVYAGDNINGVSAVQEGVRYHQETGDYTWWTGSMFCGMPNYQIGGGHFAVSDWLKPFTSLFYRGHNHAEWIFIIYFVCFFILFRSFRVNKWLCIVGAIATALSSYFIVIIAAGHNSKTSTIALMSVVLAGFHLIFQKKYKIGMALSMLFTALGFSVHPQMAYYMFLLVGTLWLAELFIHLKSKRYKDLLTGTLLFAASILVGIGTGSSNIFVNTEYAQETMRGGHSDLVKPTDSTNQTGGLDLDYATQWSYGIDETLSFLIPGFMGGSNNMAVGSDSKLYKTLTQQGVAPRDALAFCQNVPLYWGDQPFTAGNVYMGAIVCFLFVLGLYIVKGPYKWALLIATMLSTMLAWGHNCMWLTELFFRYFPLYNKFRAVSSILIVAEIAMPLLGFLAMRQLMDNAQDTTERKSLQRYVVRAGGITAGICLLFALLGSSLCSFTSQYDASLLKQVPEWLYGAIVAQRAALLTSDSWRSLLFVVAAAGILWLYVGGRMKQTYMIVALGILVTWDLWGIDKRYFNDNNFVDQTQSQSTFAMQPHEKQILADNDPHFRVLNLATNTFNDARTSYYLKSLGGYHAAKLRRYQDLIDEHLSKMNMGVVNMLNAKYIIMKGDDGQIRPMRNPDAQGNAWFVDSLLLVNNANEECEALGKIDLKRVAVADQSYVANKELKEPTGKGDGSISLVSYAPNKLTYSSQSDSDQLAVFSEIYYPHGWKVTIDGQSVNHYRVNYTLRGLYIPMGKHEIVFAFEPDAVKKGNVLSLSCTILMYGCIAWFIAQALLRRRKTS
ncbi:MAG: YfhO family protein [Bacteroidales bacterium]|nr:YfhO family protein [Bacteroidales bacterium]